MKTPARIIKTHFRYALYFDGVNDYVQLPYFAVFNQNPFTVETWVSHNAMKIGNNIFNTADANATDRNLHLAIRWGNPYLGFWADDLCGSGVLSPGIWYHLIFAWEGSATKRQLIYVDTKLDSSRVSAGLLTITSGALTGYGCRIGRMDPAYYFGFVSVTRIYSRVLTTDEISWNYNNPGNPVKDGLVLWLQADPQNVKDIDDDGILEWIDLSGYGNHGKIYGATLREIIRDY